MKITSGCEINGYIVKRLAARDKDFDVFKVVDKDDQALYLNVFSDESHMIKKMRKDGEKEQAKLEQFVWGDKHCYIQRVESLDLDYFCVDSLMAGSKSKCNCNSIVRTPMPFEFSPDEDDDNDEEGDNDDDEDDDDDDDDDDGLGENRRSQIFFDDCKTKVYKCNSLDTKADMPSILLNKTNSVGEHSIQEKSCHVQIQSPKIRGNARKSHVLRTPMPPYVQTLTDEKSFEKTQEKSICNFELKMVASAMLKRRESKSLAM